MPITKSTAQSAIKKINAENVGLEPSSLIVLFEIEVSNLADDQGITLSENEKIFRFHNNIKLLGTSLYWHGLEYIAAPIKEEGFELNLKGALPTPKLSISVNSEAIPYLAILKDKLRELGDLVGAKVTRIKTFAKFMPALTFSKDINTVPQNYDPTDEAELARDVYYIDRKSSESANVIEFELGSILDVEGLKLPSRTIFANTCNWRYRGEGCCYEYASRKDDSIHGDAILPLAAPPIATENDELITDILGNSPVLEPELYSEEKRVAGGYKKGSSVYISKGGINYYFVSFVDNPPTAPPNTSYWIKDQCSRSLKGCRLRWGTNGAVQVGDTGLTKGNLPVGMFPGVNKIR